jgi:hypothetical protein
VSIRRIVVSMESAAQDRAALEAAADIAARLQAELIGLFIEDIDLLHFAALPFAREVGFPSATRRPLDVSAMERSLRSLAGEARRALAEIAGRMPLRWSFRVARGSTSVELLAAAAEADLLVARASGIERAVLHVAVALRPSSCCCGGGDSHAPLVGVCSTALSPDRLAPMLAGLSRLFGEGVDVFLLCESPEVANEWERELRERLSTEHAQGNIRVVRAADAAELARLVDETRPASGRKRDRSLGRHRPRAIRIKGADRAADILKGRSGAPGKNQRVDHENRRSARAS